MNTVRVDGYRRDDERQSLAEKVKAINEDAALNWDNPEWRREMAAEITETIFEGFEHENLVGLMSEVENVGFDDRVFVDEVRGLRAYWVARGGYIQASHLRQDRLELPRDTVGIHVTEFEDKLRTNFAATQQTLISRGVERLDAKVNQRLLSVFQAAIPSGSDQYLSGSGVSLTTLNTAIREVKDESRSGDVAIVGRSTMVGQIMDGLTDNNGVPTGFLPETNEEFTRRGVLGTYRGARLIELRNFKDDEDDSFFPANEMFVIARDASRVAFYGGLLAKEGTELLSDYWHYMTRRDAGFLVLRPERLRRIVDTSITA